MKLGGPVVLLMDVSISQDNDRTWHGERDCEPETKFLMSETAEDNSEE